MNNSSVSDIINFGANSKLRNNLKYSIKEYIDITTDHIIKYLTNNIIQKSKIKRNYLLNIIKNDDILSDLTTSLMMADWTHDPNKSSQRYWRTKCLLYTISNILLNNKNITYPIDKPIIYNLTPDKEYSCKEQFIVTQKALRLLNSRQRKIVKYKFYRNFSDRQIARKLNLSQTRIQQNLCDIKYRLAPELECLL